MVTIVRLPKLTWTMEEGLIIRWLKNEGEEVKEGETLCEIETEKTTDEVKAPANGVLRKIFVASRNTARVDQPIAAIGTLDEPIPEVEVVKPVEEKVPVPIVKEAAKVEEVRKAERIKISPAARRIAQERGIDISKIKGTGPDGRIVVEDVLKAAAEMAKPELPVSGRLVPLAGMRKVIADRLSLSARTAVQVPITTEVDMSEVKRSISEISTNELKVTFTDFIVKAVAMALKEHPTFNSVFTKDGIIYFDTVNIGVAVSLPDGLVVPVIKNADSLGILELSKTLDRLVSKARSGELSTSEATGGAFTISNLGMYDVQIFAPIINPPESGILGVGRVVEKPVVRDGGITIRPMLTLTLVFDHRINDGAEAARFLQRIKALLEKPEELLK